MGRTRRQVERDGVTAMPPSMLTLQQLSERLQISRSTLYRHMHAGMLPPALRIGRQVRFRIADVEAWEHGLAESAAGGQQRLAETAGR